MMEPLYYSAVFVGGLLSLITILIVGGFVYGKVSQRTGKDPLGVDTNE